MRKDIAIVLLASTFLSSKALAYDVDVSDWQQLNDEIRAGNNAVVTQDMTQWEWGNINILDNNERRSWYGLSGYNPDGNYTLRGNSDARFLNWSDADMYGGNITLSIRNINFNNFNNNMADGYGGGVLNVESNSENNNLEIDSVVFKYNGMGTTEDVRVEGGAIRNYVIYGQNTLINNSVFENNSALKYFDPDIVQNENAYGGAIAIIFSEWVNNNLTQNSYNISNSVFTGNSSGYGGAVSIKTNSSAEGHTPVVEFKNVEFRNNSATIHGGAISSNTDFKLIADGEGAKTVLEGNKISGGEKEAIYMSNPDSTLTLNSVNGGDVEIKDIINGEEGYNVDITGDMNSTVSLYNNINNANVFIEGVNVNVNDIVGGIKDLELASSVLRVGVNGQLNVENMRHKSGSTATPTIQIDTDVANNQISNGVINVSGDISGSYGVIVKTQSQELSSEKSAFLKALNDDEATASDFKVDRVEGSPYMWNTVLNAEGETQGSTWYLTMDNTPNPDPGDDPDPNPNPNPNPDPKPENIQLAPEVLAAFGLHEAAIAQTNSVVANVSDKVALSRTMYPSYGIVPRAWRGKKFDNGWVSAQGEYVNVKKPVDMEGKIWGMEAGFDLQRNINNVFGVFASYRNGEYDLSGKGLGYAPTIGSEIDINSYLGGLYYRYDKNRNWLFATLYGGVQEAKVNTDDKIASFDTDGVEYGAGIEIGHSIVFNRNTSLSPILAIRYNQINYDETKDNVNKKYSWDDLKHIGVVVSASFERIFENGKIQIKPSVIQTVSSGDNVAISQMGEVDTYKDKTLGQIELSGSYDFSRALSGYGWLNYTYGSNYNATNLGLGINYNW